MILICASLRLGSFANLPIAGSAPHGGITRSTTFVFTARAQGRASSYEMSDIGAIDVGRWHSTHLAYRSGATSLLNVGAAAAGEAASPSATPTNPIRATRMRPPKDSIVTGNCRLQDCRIAEWDVDLLSK